jgi:hypothetical protein
MKTTPNDPPPPRRDAITDDLASLSRHTLSPTHTHIHYPPAKAGDMAKRRVGVRVLAVNAGARAPRGGVTRQGVVLDDDLVIVLAETTNNLALYTHWGTLRGIKEEKKTTDLQSLLDCQQNFSLSRARHCRVNHGRSCRTSSTLQHHSPGGNARATVTCSYIVDWNRWTLGWGNLVQATSALRQDDTTRRRRSQTPALRACHPRG